MTLGRRRAQEDKCWETDILRQIANIKVWEEVALRREVEAQILAHEAKEQELRLLMKILDNRVESEMTEARACETKAHKDTQLPRPTEGKNRYWSQLRKTWYLNKAQGHHNMAQQFVWAQEELENLTIQCRAVACRQRLWITEYMRQHPQQEPKINIPVAQVARLPAHGACMSVMKRLALHNNLLSQLEWQKVRTAHQEATSYMQQVLCRRQQESLAIVQEMYMTFIKDKYTINK